MLEATLLAAVSVHNLTKTYPLYARPADRLLEALPGAGPRHREFHALRDISFEVNAGETFALIGPNGCGKSTLLRVVAGILPATRGQAVTRGRVAALLELGAGFNPEFTGRENVYLNGEILGISGSRMDAVFPLVAEFAGVGEFMERPLKEYSSGMYVRLAFATAIHVDPEILIVDEALAVGDARFANRCLRKFDELKARGVTILFVSHDLGLVKRLADRALLLVGGRMDLLGSPKDAVDRYISLVQTPDPAEAAPVAGRHGDGSCQIRSVELPLGPVVRAGDPVRIEIGLTAREDCDPLVVGILIRNRLGIDIAGTNTRIEGVPASARAGESLAIRFEFECRLARGEYAVTVAAQHGEGLARDWIDDAVLFTVADARELAGSVALNPTIQVIPEKVISDANH